jgi:hypothetical protein
MRDFSWGGIFLRMLVGICLVLVSFNPSGRSYHHWAMQDLHAFSPAKAVVGAILICLWVLFVRAALQSLGLLGLALSALVVASLVWLFASWGWFEPARPSVLAWVVLVALGGVLGFGLSWSLLRRKITGQVDVDELPQP